MTPQEPYLSSSPAQTEGAAPTPAPASARGPSSFERGMSHFTTELLRERRADRRWRVFFRLAWLLLFYWTGTLLRFRTTRGLLLADARCNGRRFFSSI